MKRKAAVKSKMHNRQSLKGRKKKWDTVVDEHEEKGKMSFSQRFFFKLLTVMLVINGIESEGIFHVFALINYF